MLMRWPGGRWRVRQALADWIFARALMYGRRPAMGARLEQFAQRLVAAARAGGCDEIIVVGHSLGATVALLAIARALEADSEFARCGPKICLLTVGSTIGKLALHPAAERLRACTARVAAEESLEWTEYQARRDVISFYGFDPVMLKRFRGRSPTFKPHIRLIGMKELLTPPTYKRNWLRQMRLHYQFVMANEVRAQYDYFMIVCGPAELTRLSLAPRGVLDVFGDDGSLRAPTQVQATSADAAAGILK
jgi:pimeloyl-ACP methyl ester carboxylesterase